MKKLKCLELFVVGDCYPTLLREESIRTTCFLIWQKFSNLDKMILKSLFLKNSMDLNLVNDSG